MKRKLPQRELNWNAAEPFALIGDETQDGDRITAERERQNTNRAESAKHQLSLSTNLPEISAENHAEKSA